MHAYAQADTHVQFGSYSKSDSSLQNKGFKSLLSMQQKLHHMERRSRAQMSERGTPQHQEAVSGITSF